MKIGVTVQFLHSYFSTGTSQTSLALAELFRLQGHEVHFIQVGPDDKKWWDDVTSFQKDWTVVHIDSVKEETYDLLLEIGKQTLQPAKRKIGKRSVWVCRKNPLLTDIEESLFSIRDTGRSMEGVVEVWLFDEFATEDDVQYLEVQTRRPVRVLPYVWSPSPIEAHRGSIQSPVWQQVIQLEEVKSKPFSIHICETNNSVASSCYIPLFIAKEAKKKWKELISSDVKIHNSEHLKNVEFFKSNVYEKAVESDISGQILGRQRVIDFVYDPASIVIAHSRFQCFRPYLFDLLWVGIPFIHNSDVLRKELGLEESYYSNNNILEGREAFGHVIEKARKATLEDLFTMRKKIFERYTPISSRIQDAYKDVFNGVMKQEVKNSNEFRVGFSDMWENFQVDYNPFVLMLQAATQKKVIGIDVKDQCPPDVLIFGPFGDSWRSVSSSIPKIHYTGENTKPIEHPDVKLNLGFQHRKDFYPTCGEDKNPTCGEDKNPTCGEDKNPTCGEDKANYIRLPLWMLEINWFRADINRLQNPKPVSIDACCKVQDDLQNRSKFCSFVVSNPSNTIRNDAFQWLSKYKQVDSAGRLFNNIGSDIFAGLGGGGGELKKVEFMKQYKFALTYENSSAPGYTTEKLFHAKVAGCVPIYWGDSEVEKDFDVKGFLDARKVTSEEELIALVKEVDMNDELWKEKASVPALTVEGRDRVRRVLAKVANQILELGGVKGDFPEMIGFTSDKDEEDKKTSNSQTLTVKPVSETIFVTGANLKFLPSLQLQLQTLQAQKQGVKGVKVLVYLMKDVPSEIEAQFKEYDFVEICRFPDYPDIWEPQHFAWKLYILQKVVNDEQYKGHPIIYLDAGAMVARWPEAYIQNAIEKGVVVLEDPRQENRRWCHMEFCKQLQVTEDELKSQQIWAGSIAFVGGAKPAKELFDEAWKWAQVREVIAGPKWSGIDGQGRPMGHRHDQSILSILSYRKKVYRMPLDEVYGDISLRQTFLKGQSLYVHRGGFIIHKPVLEGIDDVWVINLDRRQDRIEKFMKTNESIADRVLRLPAFDGKTLPLTPKLARLFAPHDFNWKKSVMGCALSHLAMWMKLVTDKPDIKSYLICEDDAVLDPKWKETWSAMMKEKALPEDWDVVYLGGVLPPNRKAFEDIAVEKVNSYVGRVKENTIFGQQVANRYFHFCAYAYVLSRRGAQKVLDVLKSKQGYWTSADHMICNINQVLNIYFTHPLLAGCFQDNDPAYQQSAFNDFSRVDSFDSDLWNNKEQFTQDEVLDVMKKADKELDLLGALEDARNFAVDVIGRETVQKKLLQDEGEKQKRRRFVTVTGDEMKVKELYEYDWLKNLFGHDFCIEQVSSPQDDEPIVVLQGYKNVVDAIEVLKGWRDAGKSFYILHLSDEFARDPIHMYEWAKGVVRTYIRDGLKESEKVIVIPLGYHWSSNTTTTVTQREFVWSFIGTNWKGRVDKLKVCEQIPGNHKLVLMDEWNSPSGVPKEEMLTIMENTLCIPCPVGNNRETFRFYEALEAGCVPIVVKEEGMEKLLEWWSPYMKVLPCESWLHAAQLIFTLKEKPEVYEQYRAQLLHGWIRMKREMKDMFHKVLEL
jgi:GR25 family glycosyltransferase involved in LPS biosynthesis